MFYEMNVMLYYMNQILLETCCKEYYDTDSRCTKLTRKSEHGSERVSIGVSVEREARESLNI